MKKKTKIAIVCVSAFLAILFIALMIYYFGASFPQFNKLSNKEFNIPGLDTHFCPQGLTYNNNHEVFMVSGYMSNGDPSRVYFVKNNEDYAYKFVTFTLNNEKFTGHVGGVATHQNYGWLASDKKVYRFSLTDALNAENGTAIEIIDSFETNNGADFILTDNNKLIVGEFYREKNYATEESHKIKTDNNKINPAISFIYTINQDNLGGVESVNPEAAISSIGLVQGMTFTKDGNIVLSTSYSLPASKLYVYNNVLNKPATKTFNINNTDIPLYMLDDNELVKTIVAPCMSEEVVLKDNRVYVLFESACKKYKLFTRTRLTNVYSLDI